MFAMFCKTYTENFKSSCETGQVMLVFSVTYVPAMISPESRTECLLDFTSVVECMIG